MKKATAKKIAIGLYVYRGVRIENKARWTNGSYVYRWEFQNGLTTYRDTSLRGAKMMIDWFRED